MPKRPSFSKAILLWLNEQYAINLILTCAFIITIAIIPSISFYLVRNDALAVAISSNTLTITLMIIASIWTLKGSYLPQLIRNPINHLLSLFTLNSIKEIKIVASLCLASIILFTTATILSHIRLIACANIIFQLITTILFTANIQHYINNHQNKRITPPQDELHYISCPPSLLYFPITFFSLILISLITIGIASASNQWLLTMAFFHLAMINAALSAIFWAICLPRLPKTLEPAFDNLPEVSCPNISPAFFLIITIIISIVALQMAKQAQSTFIIIISATAITTLTTILTLNIAQNNRANFRDNPPL